MRVAGIDQSYTGFGFSVDGESKKRAFPPGRYDSDTHRLVGVRTWFTQWLQLQHNVGIDLVVMEGYANMAKHGREMSGELGGVVKMAVLDVVGHPPLIVPPSSLKKFVTGSGGSPKNIMIAHVYKKWGIMFSNDNQADAFALEKFGEVYHDVVDLGGTDHFKYEIEAVKAVREAQ